MQNSAILTSKLQLFNLQQKIKSKVRFERFESINLKPNACESKAVLYADDSVLLCTDVNTENSKVNAKIRFFNLKIGLIRTNLR